MARNLKYQFKHAIDSVFVPGRDKHSAKQQGNLGSGTVWSYSDRKNLIDVSANFANFMKDNFPNIKKVKDIESKHFQAFLDLKAKKCTSETLGQYKEMGKKISKIVNSTYNIKTQYVDKNVIAPCGKEKSRRNISMSKEDFKKVENVIKDSKSHGAKAITLAGHFGLRVAETTKLQNRDIKISENGKKATVHIHKSKGGRSRDIVVTDPIKVDYLKDFKSNLSYEAERIVPIGNASVNKFLNRTLKSQGITKYKDAKTGIHAIRKMAAQEYYDECRENGMTKQDALSSTSEYLGHGKNRDELMKRYVENIH